MVIAISGGDVLWRIPCSPQEFATRALAAPDPFAELSPLPLDVAQAVVAMLSTPPDEIAQQWAGYLSKARRRRQTVTPREHAVHSQMQTGMANVYAGKQFVLLQDLLDGVAHEDTDIVGDLVRGAPITGNLRYPNVFQKVQEHDGLQASPVEDLWHAAPIRQLVFEASARLEAAREHDEDLAAAVRQATQQ